MRDDACVTVCDLLTGGRTLTTQTHTEHLGAQCFALGLCGRAPACGPTEIAIPLLSCDSSLDMLHSADTVFFFKLHN